MSTFLRSDQCLSCSLALMTSPLFNDTIALDVRCGAEILLLVIAVDAGDLVENIVKVPSNNICLSTLDLNVRR